MDTLGFPGQTRGNHAIDAVVAYQHNLFCVEPGGADAGVDFQWHIER